MKEKLIKNFLEIYGKGESNAAIAVYFSPGRVNLIGEHIDYNGGFVFPCALNIGTYMLVRKRTDNIINFRSMNFDIKVTINLLDEIANIQEHNWANYPKGIMKYFMDGGITLSGMDILYYGNIPNGSGLSSSASLEVATAYALNDLFQAGYDLLKLVQLSQAVERGFMGVNCGIMDQFAVGFGKTNSAIMLNCDTLDYTYVPLELGEYKIVICNTNKKRGLGESKYNERRSECERAVTSLKTKVNIEYLCELSGEEFEANKSVIEDQTVQSRAEHAVYENERVKKALEVLNKNDLKAFGELMSQSHESLRDLYEVSCEELDIMVEEAMVFAGEKGTLGARMTGAGFGGCTVNIVHEACIDEFNKQVIENYNQRTGLKGEIYIASVDDGVRKL